MPPAPPPLHRTTTAPGTTAAASCALDLLPRQAPPVSRPFDGGTWTYYDTSAAEAAAAARVQLCLRLRQSSRHP